jgi:hypothetical protein
MLERASASLAYYKGFFMRGKGVGGGEKALTVL